MSVRRAGQVPLALPAQPGARPRVPRVGVVLAAGRSVRMRPVTGGGSKALVRLGGLSLVERAIRTLLRAGVERVVVVLGYHAGPVGAVASRAGGGRVQTVIARGWEAGNGASLAAAEGAVGGEELFALLTTDHLFGDGALDALLTAGEPAVLVDPAPDPEAWKEGCRVRIRDGVAVGFGKGLEEPAIDCGAFVLPREVFRHVRGAAAAGDHSLAGAVSRLAGARPLRALPIREASWWHDVDTPWDLRIARYRLRRSLIKETDGPVSRYLNRPISTRISMALAPLRPSPDLVSVAAFALALASAALLGGGRGLAGGLLAQAASVLDGVDGEVARLQLRGSAWGALLDGVLDRLGDAAVLAGLGVWALSGTAAPGTVVALTAAAVAGAMLSMATKDRAAALGMPAAPERALGWLLGGRDGRLLLVMVGALLAEPAWALLAVSGSSGIGLLLRVAIIRRRHAAAGP